MLSLRREPSGGLPDEAPAESRASKFAAGLRARLGSAENSRGPGGGAGGGGAGSRLNSLRTRIMRGDLQTHTTDTAENSPVAPRMVRSPSTPDSKLQQLRVTRAIAMQQQAGNSRGMLTCVPLRFPTVVVWRKVHMFVSALAERVHGCEQERMGSSASDLPTGDSVIADVRSRLSAGVKGLGARLGRSSSPAGAAAGDAPSEDGSSESGGGGVAGGLAVAQQRSVADRLADKLSDVRRTLLDQPPRPAPAAEGEARALLLSESAICRALTARGWPHGLLTQLLSS